MDAETKEQWKWKFYRLVLHLNAVIILIAVTVIAGILAPEAYRVLLVAVLSLIDIAIIVTFMRNYHTTKAWLDEHTVSGNPD
ncbi:MAG: hypothetical protein A4E35_00204 [Methanoregula sp. PtaU1.Bin051]|nr:MAG: hypothetical protein A4E35_00204 [Methanoregula sp. PtaU1.Bin051]